MLCDLGYYSPLYGRVQNATMGFNAGCTFISDKCNTAGGGSGNFFCWVGGGVSCARAGAAMTTAAANADARRIDNLRERTGAICAMHKV